MKLTLKIKLLPNEEQGRYLLQTIREANACNMISSIAWEQKTFQPFKLHHASYSTARGAYNMSSQVVVRCISKVAHAYIGCRLGSWSFYQLRKFLEYKAQLSGITCVAVDPAYTSKTCHRYKHIGKRKNKVFQCTNCKTVLDADENAAKNIALLGAIVNCPEKSERWSCSLHCRDLSPEGITPLGSLQPEIKKLHRNTAEFLGTV